MKRYEEIKKDAIQEMQLISSDKLLPAIKIVTLEETFEFSLVTGFEIHLCNEFLRSLELGNQISFQTFRAYGSTIQSCSDLLKIQRILNAEGLNALPDEILSVLLDDTDIFGFNALKKGIEEDCLDQYIKKAAA